MLSLDSSGMFNPGRSDRLSVTVWGVRTPGHGAGAFGLFMRMFFMKGIMDHKASKIKRR